MTYNEKQYKKLDLMSRMVKEMEGWTLDDWKQLEIRFIERLICLSLEGERMVIERIEKENADK